MRRLIPVIPATFVTLFYIFPVLTLFRRALTVQAFRDIAASEALANIAWFTLWQAVMSTVLTVAIGIAPAYVLARFSFAGRRLATALITVPFVLPTVVVGAAFSSIFNVRDSVWAVIGAHMFFNLAVVVRPLADAWSQLPRQVGYASQTLGSSPIATMRRVTIPLLRGPLIASASIVFLFSFTSFGVARLLGGPSHSTIEVEVWRQASQLGNVGTGAALSAVQLMVLATLGWWSARSARRYSPRLIRSPIDSRQPARSSCQHAAVASVCAGSIVLVAVPIWALINRSLRTGARPLLAWRALFGFNVSAGVTPTTVAAIQGLKHALLNSLSIAAAAVTISLVVGVLAAISIARGAIVLDVLMMAPLATSAVSIGLGFIISFDAAPVDWRASWWLIPIGHALIGVPFVVRGSLPILRSIDPRQRYAAATLGASPLRVWRSIDGHRIIRPVITAAGFVAIISLGEFGAASVLSRSSNETLPIVLARLIARPVPILHAAGYAMAGMLAIVATAIVVGIEFARPHPHPKNKTHHHA